MESMLRPRWLAASMYALYCVAGLAFLILPSVGLRELLGTVGFYAWNGMLVLGGFVGALSSLKRKFRIELIGVPGVVTGLGVYGIYCGIAATASDNPGVVIGLAAVFLGAAFGAVGRGFEVQRHASIVERISKEIADEKRGHGNG
jgi:hypothetical protein